VAIKDRLMHAWNAFITLDRFEPFQSVASYGNRPDRTRLHFSNEKSIVSSIYNRIAIDVAAATLKHVRLDDQGRFESEIDSGLNQCLTVEANIDQAPRAFRQDIVLTLFDEGVAAIVPVDTTVNPNDSGSFDIKTLRVGTVRQWMPEHVRVLAYNDNPDVGKREEVTLRKKFVAVVENPLYAVMNEQSSTLQRLIRKLNLLDVVDEQTSSGKLDMIIQLPYVIKSEARQKQADQRRKQIELQLKGSQYGIAYTDGTEKITQLNRPSENNLLKQVEYLTELLYSQLGITKAVMDGTASESEMRNYHQRTIIPILTAIVEAMRRSFLTKTARSQRQSISYFLDPFALVPVEKLADLADKFTRNEILSSNEFRDIVGRPPSKDPKADQLRNSNMPESELGRDQSTAPQEPPPERLRSAS
jgi:Phage portal protein